MINEYPRNATQVLKFNPQINGLRFCAVLVVVCYHWLPTISDIKMSSFFGGIVNFFFVLSSYLITRILFSAKEKGIKIGIQKFRIIKIFLIRRTIRIFPAYYIFLLVLLLLPTIRNEINHNAGMYFYYLANYHIFQSPDWPVVTSHIWTLAVEEQFYLIWPLLIIFIPYRHLLKSFIIIIIGSVVLRAIVYDPAYGIRQAILTHYCVDAFAVGGLLAYKYMTSDKERIAINKYFNIVLYIGIPVGILIILTKSLYFSFVINRLLFALISLKIIEGAIIGYKNNFGKFLQNKVVMYLGSISYGIYLYHLLVPVLFWKLYNFSYEFVKVHYSVFFIRHEKEIMMVQNFLVLEVVRFIIYAVLVVAIATISWNFVEKPINKLKV